MKMGSKVCSLRFSLQGEMLDPSIKPIALFNQVKISKVFHCDGLVLCVAKDNSKLVLWNPYLGQTRWILPRRKFQRSGSYALGYADHNNNHNHKILRLTNDSLQVEFEIYDVSSSFWRVLELNTDWTIERRHRGVTMKGNVYFFAKEKIIIGEGMGEEVVYTSELERFLVCFDFTRERFGQRLHLPFPIHGEETMTLSCVREEQLAVLYQRVESYDILEIWVTNKIDPNAVSWSKFLRVNMRPLTDFQFDPEAGSFFIDEEKKVAVVFDEDIYDLTESFCNQTAYIIGEDGYLKSVKIGETPIIWKSKFSPPLVSPSYLPSLVQIN